MSDLARQNPNMAPQISPKDVPKEEEEADSDGGPQDEPVFVELDSISSSEEELEDHGEEGINTQGYILLSQDVPEAPEGFLQQQTEQPVSSDGSQGTEAIQMPDVDTEPKQAGEPLELNMQQEEVDLIRQVMSNITLPTSAIPDWAKVIPEDKWKASLVTNIHTKTCKSPDREPEK